MLRKSVTASSNSFGARDIDVERRKGQLLLLFDRVGAPQKRVQAREQLLAAHRLDHVVVRAMLQRKDDVLLGIAHRDEEDRHRLRDIAAQPAEHLGSRDVGHLPVEHEEIEALAPGHAHRLAARQPAVHVVAVRGDPALEQRELVGIVF
jgi:hypothetical protein